jgi:hypothetical protein
MKAVILGSLLAGIVGWVAARIGRSRGKVDEEPMLPEPDTDWTD